MITLDVIIWIGFKMSQKNLGRKSIFCQPPTHKNFLLFSVMKFKEKFKYVFASPEPPRDGDDPPQPPRRFKKEMIYESLPDSLKTEVLVRTKIETDEEVLKIRQELCRQIMFKIECYSLKDKLDI